MLTRNVPWKQSQSQFAVGVGLWCYITLKYVVYCSYVLVYITLLHVAHVKVYLGYSFCLGVGDYLMRLLKQSLHSQPGPHNCPLLTHLHSLVLHFEALHLHPRSRKLTLCFIWVTLSSESQTISRPVSGGGGISIPCFELVSSNWSPTWLCLPSASNEGISLS